MTGKVLNIEIGDRICKVCRSVKHGKSFQIENSFLFRTPDGAVTDGFINDPAALARTLGEELTKNGLGGMKEVIFTLTSGRVATREVTLPPVKENRIQALVETNAADYFPVDMSGYNVSHALLERVTEPEPGLRVQVMAAPSALVESYISLADACGFKILFMDYSGNSQFQALRAFGLSGVTMYVTLDPGSTCCSFIGDGTLLLQRTFAFGGHDMISAYLSATNRSGEAYLSAMDDLNCPDCVAISREDASDTVERLVSSVVRSADFFTSTRDTGVDRIVLMGSCAHLIHLRELIAESAGVDTVYLDELPDAGQLANSARDVSCYISCVGSSVAPVDFLPASYKNRRKRGLVREKRPDSLTDGVLICGVCVAAALVLCAFSVLGYLGERRELKSVQDRISELSYVQQVYDSYTAYSANVDGINAVKATVLDHNAQLENFFTELESKMPAEILLLSASCTNEGVTLSVTVPDFTEAAVVISQLRTFDSVSLVSVSSITKEETDSGTIRATFTVTCQYPVPEQKADGTAGSDTSGSGQTAAGGSSPSGSGQTSIGGAAGSTAGQTAAAGTKTEG